MHREGAGGVFRWAQCLARFTHASMRAFAFLNVHLTQFSSSKALSHCFGVMLFVLASAQVYAAVDIQPLNVTLGSSSVVAGGSLSVSWQIRNNGTTSAGTSNSQVRITTSNAASGWGSPANNVGTAQATGPIGAGITINQNTTVTVPTTPGTYYVWVVADNGSVLTQTLTSNDYAVSTALTVTGATDTSLPIVSGFSVTPSSLTVGSSFTIFYTVSDSGGSGLWQAQLWRAPDIGGVPGTWAKITTTSLSGNGPVSGSFTDAPTSQGSYWYGVHGVDNAINIGVEPNGAKVVVNNVTVTTPATPTGATTGGVTGTSSGPGPVTLTSTVNMSWNTVSGTGVDYNLIVTDITNNTQALNIRTTSNTYTTPLTAGHQYSWQVAACNTTGCSSYTAAQYFQTPGTTPSPPSITVTSPVGGESWTAGSTHSVTWAISGDTSQINYQLVAYSTDGGTTYSNISVAQTPSTRSFNWTLPNTVSSTQVRVRVRAMDVNQFILAAGASASNFTISAAVTAPPGSFTVTATPYCDTTGGTSTGAVRLDWGQSSTATSYDAYRDGVIISGNGTGMSSTQFTFNNNATNLAGQTHTYFIRAHNTSTSTTDSNNGVAVSVTVPSNICTAPAPLTLTQIQPNIITQGTGSPTVTFFGTGFTSSSWPRFSTSLGVVNQPATIAPTNITPTSMTVTINSSTVQTETWQVCASNGSSTCSGTQMVTVQTAAPAAPPTALTLTNENPRCDFTASAVPAVRLNWTPSTNVSTYQVYRNGSPIGNTKTSSTVSSYELGLAAGQTYNYKVVASNALGVANSNTITISIPASICTNNTQSGASIIGNVTSSGNPLSGVTISASGATNTPTVTSANGSYSYTNVSIGTVTLTPSLAGYSFSPSSTAIVTTASTVMFQDFRACAIGSTLSGSVRDTATNASVSGATVTVDGNPAIYSNGVYTKTGLSCGSHQITVNATGYASYVQNIDTFSSWTVPIGLTKNSTVNGVQTNSGSGGDPVNTATGNYIYQHRDVQLPGKGMPFVFERNYNSQAGSEPGTVSGPLGFGWTHNYNASLGVDGSGNITINWGDGKTEVYAADGTGGFTHQYGVFDTLTANAGGTYTLKKKDLTSYNFDATYHLASIVDKNGNTIALTYTGGNLTQVTDTAGRNIDFTYDASNRIVTITDPITRTVQFTYDPWGNLVTAQDANSNITLYTYDGFHQMLTAVDPRGSTVVTNVYDATLRVVNSQRDAKAGHTDYVYSVYDGDKRLTTFTDAMGNVTQHYHDKQLRLVQEVNPNGDIGRYTYDDKGNRNTVTDKNGKTTKYVYDAAGNVLSKEDALNHISTITYDATTNNPLTRTDALNNTTTFTYDANGNLLTVKDALNNSATNTYNAAGQVLTTTDARNNTTTNTYDTQGNLIQVTDALNNSTVLTYDGAGRRLTKKDALNRTTSFTYDNNDNLLSSIDPNLKSAAATYDGNNNRITASDKRGNVTQFAYDVKDLLTTTTDPLTKTVVNTYDALDRKTAVQDKNGNTAQFAYDGVGNLISAANALNQVTHYTYDANGNRLSATDAMLHVTQYTYDAMNRQVTAADALANQTTTAYDVLGRVASTTNAKGQVTSLAYDNIGRLTQVTDASGGTVKYTYDTNGNRLTMTDPNGHITSYTYDALNRLITKTEPLGVTQYQYDAVGNRKQLTQPNGTIIQYAYDNLNRLQTITYPDTTTVGFTYDFDGNRTGMTDALGTSSAQYDALGRMTSYTDAYGKTVGYGYDFNGNRTSLTYPGAKTASYAYDALNRMTGVTDWLTHQTTYSYDTAGRLTGSNDPNSVATAYGFDIANRLTSLSHAQGATPIASYAYTLDEIGNHKQVTQTEPLPAVVTPGTASYTYDTENRLTAINGVANTYDLNGNMTAKGTDAYTYDIEDRLQQSTLGGTASQYQYDGLGHRYAKTSAGATTRYVLDLNSTLSKVLMETDAAGAASAYYVYGLGLISRISAAGTASYYHFDTRGSTIALTDAAGTVTDKYAYDPFGNLTNSQGATPNPFKYVGQYGVMDEGSGLYYIRARYYDAQIGRFINKDPKMGNDQDGQSLNRYAYAQNNPVRFVDVSGFNPNEVGEKSCHVKWYQFYRSGCYSGGGYWAGQNRSAPVEPDPKVIAQYYRDRPPVSDWDNGAFFHDFGYSNSGAEGLGYLNVEDNINLLGHDIALLGHEANKPYEAVNKAGIYAQAGIRYALATAYESPSEYNNIVIQPSINTFNRSTDYLGEKIYDATVWGGNKVNDAMSLINTISNITSLAF